MISNICVEVGWTYNLVKVLWLQRFFSVRVEAGSCFLSYNILKKLKEIITL
jgi:hypothetical protein